MELFSFKNKVAIVTGCSRLNGLGYGMAEGLAEAGADIAGVSRRDLNEVRRKIESLGLKFLPINEDLSNKNSFSVIIEKILNEFGKII